LYFETGITWPAQVVIPGQTEGLGPESMHTDGCSVPTGLATREPNVFLDSGLAASPRPGMTSGEA
jgi:hypothetical protein